MSEIDSNDGSFRIQVQASAEAARIAQEPRGLRLAPRIDRYLSRHASDVHEMSAEQI